MHDMVKRLEVQVLRRGGHTQEDTAAKTGVSVTSVRRIEREAPIVSLDDAPLRRIGRPSKIEAYRAAVVELCNEKDSTGRPLQSKEIVRRLRAKGFKGAKTSAYALIASVRPVEDARPMVRFEGFPGEFCQHDFGEVDVVFADKSKKRIQFFASRMKFSRMMRVSVVDDQKTETLVRGIVQHYAELGAVPLVAVFDRPKTVALAWNAACVVTRWNRVFVDVMLDLGVAIEVCWPARGNQKGSVERLVGWVKNSFFKQRVFNDEADLNEQLEEWLVEVNTQTKSRATGEIPETRMRTELARMRPLKVSPAELALRVPVVVGPTGFVVDEEGHEYMLPATAIGISGTMFVHKDTVRIVVGKHQVVYERPPKGAPHRRQAHPHLKVEMVAAVSGERGRRYLMREQLLDVGAPAHDFLTELVHRKPRTWYRDVERLHALLIEHDNASIFRAFKRAVDENTIGVEYIAHWLRLGGRPAAQPATATSDTNLSVAAGAGPASVVDIKAGRPTRGER
jgi:transposase